MVAYTNPPMRVLSIENRPVKLYSLACGGDSHRFGVGARSAQECRGRASWRYDGVDEFGLFAAGDLRILLLVVTRDFLLQRDNQ